MRVGDVVIPIGDTRLVCGGGWYTHAIVVQVEPLVLVSEQADMLWSTTTDRMHLQSLCQASAAIIGRAMERARRDGFKV